jgi:hypothetical protein
MELSIQDKQVYDEKQEKLLRLKTHNVNISNLYELGKSLSPYITNLKLNNNTINSDQFQFHTKYNIPFTESKNVNIVLSSPSNIENKLDYNKNVEIKINTPSGKITIENGICYSGNFIRFKLINNFIKENNNILLTINNFDSTTIPVLVVEKIELGYCIIRIYNSGTEDLPNLYDIAFLII